MKIIFTSLMIVINLTFVFSQTKINASTFGSLEARSLGPGTMSGRITSIEGVNKDGKTIYVGTAGGGIWKSTNAGASYKPIFDKYCQSIGALAIDQKNSDIIYCGTGESNMRNSVSIGVGLYKSTDAGENWTKIGLDSTEHISKIIIDPSNSNIIYVSAPGPLWSDSPHRGLYKSIDAGKTWEKILFIDQTSGCADMAIHPKQPNILYATTWQFRRLPYSFNSGGKGSGMYKSEDSGKTWQKLTQGLPTGDFGRIALALAPSAPENLIAIVESNNTGLYISADSGENWKQQSATFNVVSRPFYFSTLVIDPNDAKRVYRPALSFSYSDDGGYSFSDGTHDGGWVHSDHHALWINPNNTQHMILGTDGGVYTSNDRGATFSFCHNLPVGQFYNIALDNEDPYRIYGGLQDNGSWYGPSAKPGGIHNGDWTGIYFGDGFWTIPDLVHPGIAYAEYQGGNAARIDLNTLKSYDIKPFQTEKEDKLRWNWNTPLTQGQKNPKNLYMGAQYLFKSADQGRNWTRISPDLTTNDKEKQKQENSGGLSADNTSAENHCTIFTIVESPLDENVLWVGTDDGNLQLSQNGGKQWKNLSNAYNKAEIPKQSWVSSIDISLHDPQTVFATFDNHMYGDHRTYAAKSSDLGKTWTLFKSPEFTGFAHKIKQDRINKDLLFIGTEMGLFATLDGGDSWFRMKNGISDYSLVRDIEIHPKENALVIGTHGRGIYVIDDISAMRKMTKEFADQDVKLLPLDSMELTTGRFSGQAVPSTSGWSASNPESIRPIQYYLKDRIMNGDVKIDILDMNGTLIRNLPAGKRKGINKVTWNFRMKPPKVAEGGTKIDYGAFTAPTVLPGKYLVKLTAGDNVISDTLTLIHIDKPDFTLEDRQLQYDIAMKYYAMHEHLAKTVDEINAQQTELLVQKNKLKTEEYKASFDEYHKDLEELRNTLLASKNKSIFADETKLREEISEAYGAVAGTEQRPSNLSLERVTVLQKKVTEAFEKMQDVKNKHNQKIQRILKKEGLQKNVKP
ncbi:MAG: glycosyl hydrolase [Bacteroidota bacterium]|nr:glycosyl hydrolase [Bacteroidota bacterium]